MQDTLTTILTPEAQAWAKITALAAVILAGMSTAARIAYPLVKEWIMFLFKNPANQVRPECPEHRRLVDTVAELRDDMKQLKTSTVSFHAEARTMLMAIDEKTEGVVSWLGQVDARVRETETAIAAAETEIRNLKGK